MTTDHVQPQPGRRPTYPVDTEESGESSERTSRPGMAPLPPKPKIAADDPASDANTESANHPNDE
jgi:hypothetical protein